jgi:protease secretion system membrane fusion protein
MRTAFQAPITNPAFEVDLNDARPRRWGWFLLLISLGSFLLWASLAPLDAAVSTSGTVVVSSSRKLVQPVSGGKVADILVREGDSVRSGQLLMRLDETPSRSQLEIAQGQWLVALATEARLVAEQKGNSVIDFSPALMELGQDERVSEVVDLQSRLLFSRRQMRNNEMRGMEASIRGLEYQVQGYEASRFSKETQGQMLRQELHNQRTLADAGYYPRNRVSEQERVFAGLIGGVAEDMSSAGRTRQAMAEIRARMATREQEFRKEIESQLSDAQRDASILESRIRVLEFDLSNTEIRAPVTGIVIGLNVHTVGGVVNPGVPVMELVPKGDPLRIEAQIAINLIDKVKTGMDVDLMFSAFNQATTPRIEGKVVQISADAVSDSRQNTNFFKLVVEVAPQGMGKLQQHEVRAGMPVEVFIKTGERTFMSYLFKPVMDGMRRALIEP